MKSRRRNARPARTCARSHDIRGVTLHRLGLTTEAQKRPNECVPVLQTTGPHLRAPAPGELASIETEKRNFSEARTRLHEAIRIESGPNETSTLPRLLLIAGNLAGHGRF